MRWPPRAPTAGPIHRHNCPKEANINNRSRLIALASAIAALGGLAAWSPPSIRRLGIEENPGYTWGNALQVAYPEYQIYHRGSVDTTEELFSATTAVELDTHMNALTVSGPRQTFYISQSLLGDATFPALPRSHMSSHLKDFKGGLGESSEEKREAMRQAKQLPAAQQVLVLVELTKPLPETALDRILAYRNSEWKRFFLSGTQTLSEKPLYWWPGWNGCSAVVIRSNNCGHRSVTADFREWVSQLSEEDAENLQKIGLDLQQMRTAAEEGLIYGFIDTRSGSRDLMELLERPEIRTVKVLERVPEPQS
ncbi:hypothetical protein [Nonomuraea sp. NPDC050310]|uniref:hypothetical protein n=1 Tax=Nonomuraea sp. NPDC050310 TaxID=3154935 RepID=UPI0033E5E72B